MASLALKNKRKNAKASISRIKTYLDKNKDKILDIQEYEVREEALNLSYEKFCEAQDEIELVDSHPDDDLLQREEVESLYLSLRAEIKKYILKSISQNISSVHKNPSSFNNSKMPEIVIEKFSGDQKNWASFFDIFSALVLKNDCLDDVQKLIYLKSSLKGEALRLIDTLSLKSENLATALNILKDRYQNKLATIYAHIKGLVELPSLNKGSPSSLRDFIVNIKQNTESLKNLSVPVTEWDLILVYLLIQKLDFNSRRAYELDRGPTELPSLDNFLKFLEKRCLASENLSSPEIKCKSSHFAASGSGGQSNIKSNVKGQSQNACFYCKLSNHNIKKCFKFKSLNLSQRKQFIFNKRLCFKCFSPHQVNQCSGKNCPICDQPHNALLHPNQDSNPNQARSNARSGGSSFHSNSPSSELSSSLEESNVNTNNILSDRSEGEVSCSAAIISSHQHHVLIATASVLVCSRNGKTVVARAILDSGSQVSLVTSSFVKTLHLQPYVNSTQISGVSGKKSVCNNMVDLKVLSAVDSSKKFDVRCSVMDKITCPLPQISLNIENLKIPNTMLLADPDYGVPGNIDLLLGSDVYYEIIEPGLLKLGDGLPVLQNSGLGWVIGGPISPEYLSLLNTVESQENVVALFTSTMEINNLMQRFWSLEEVPNNKILSEDDVLAEQLFKDSTRILENGRFQVDFPLKSANAHSKLGESFRSAEKRFYSLERKLHRDKQLFQEYKTFIDEYVNLNHARYIPLQLKNENNEHKYFIPHHCIVRNDKTTTRLRVVFDASMKTTSGYSLNDITLKGYQTQPDLFDILLRFRTFDFVLVVDIEKMFRQIVINPSRTFLQNILWRDDPKKELKCIELTVLSYGVNFAPFLSTRCLIELANKYSQSYPLAAEALKKQCYMDDILCGTNSFDELLELRQQLTNLLKIAGFSLHKWNSNCKNFLEHCNETVTSSCYEIASENHSNRVLGILWNPSEDYFSISLPKDIKINSVTKRNVLSIISQIYDPLGFVSPIVVKAKMLMQNIWLANLTWDQVLNEELTDQWMTFVRSLSDLSKQRIPRCFISSKDLCKVELHGFADASMKAYGACLYIRGFYKNNVVSCHLICSKSRIAPLRTVSLPRLELCACLLLANLANRVLGIVNIKFDSKNLWTDSQISLCWIKSHPSRWNIFVSNRVEKIQELTSELQWRHVRSDQNPADYLSRGLSSSELLSCCNWWRGPEFLSDFKTNLDYYQIRTKMINVPEQRKIVETPPEKIKTICLVTENDFLESITERFSSFLRLQRVVAYCLRFRNNCKNVEKKHGPIEVSELHDALIVILKLLQEKYFFDEINLLKKGKPLSNKRLLVLSPFLDETGILRVGGRLDNADISYCQKYPALLPANSHVVALMLQREHIRLYHAGAQTVLSNFRLKFWPLNGLTQTKRIVKNCVTCYRFKAKAASQIMASLPKDRVKIARPFEKTGIDFGGPFLIKTSRLRKAPVIKAYISIFVCMVTKCVHIELVTSLSTEAFLLTLKRFIARRGNPTIIYSDNATNFLGARNHLRVVYEFFRNTSNLNSIKNFLSSNEITWKFIPPRSPHWGGIWEAAIKSAKYHIFRVVGDTRLTFEEFSTVLASIESILNSRPLTALSEDPSDMACLTPGHFLIGGNLSAYPEKDVTKISDNRLTVWQKCLQMQQSFWKRWSVEYLNRLQNKPKWLSDSKPLQLNQIVLLKDEINPPLKWSLGRVIETINGRDGKVRLVKVRTGDGVFTRSITKLCPLPDDNYLSQSVNMNIMC